MRVVLIVLSCLLASAFSDNHIPDEIKSLNLEVVRTLQAKNFKGIRARLLESHHCLIESRDGMWDCNDRAEVVKKIAESRGMTSRYVIERGRFKGDLNHKYVVVRDFQGKEHDLLRINRGLFTNRRIK